MSFSITENSVQQFGFFGMMFLYFSSDWIFKSDNKMKLSLGATFIRTEHN